MKLNEVVPWGRSLAEYKLMFDLSEADLKKHILGCGDGPASFNSELTAIGGQVISVDPIYQFSGAQIKQRIEATRDTMIPQVWAAKQRFKWDFFKDPDNLGRVRLNVMREFLQDFEAGLKVGRYLPAALPNLPFRDGQFDLCLCSHLLFLYSEQLSQQFHIEAIQELLWVATEVRIFPLLGLDGQPSPHREAIRAHFEEAGYKVQVRKVGYEFQVGGNEMMVFSV